MESLEQVEGVQVATLLAVAEMDSPVATAAIPVCGMAEESDQAGSAHRQIQRLLILCTAKTVHMCQLKILLLLNTRAYRLCVSGFLRWLLLVEMAVAPLWTFRFKGRARTTQSP